MAQNAEATLIVKIKETGKQALGDIASGLDDIKVKAGIASAAITAFIGLSIKDYANAEKASVSLNAAIRNQGLDVEKLSKKYTLLAKAIQDKTTFDDDAVISGIALAQNMAGQIELSENLIKATVDYAAATGTDLQTAFMMVGKSIGSNVNAFERYGISIDQNATKTEKLSQLTVGLQSHAHGAAEALGKTLGGSLGILNNQIKEVLEIIGKQFAPYVSSLTEAFIKLAKKLQDDTFAKYAAIVLGISAAITGLVSALGILVGVFPTVIAGLTLLRTGFSLLLGPIGLITIAITSLFTAWQTNFLGMQTILKNFVSNAGTLLGTFGKLLKSVFTMDINGVKKSVDQVKTILNKGIEEQKKEEKKKTDEEIANEEAAAAAKVRIRTEKAKEEEDLEKKRVLEMLDWKKQKEKDALDERIRVRQQAEKAEKERIQNIVHGIEYFISGGLQKLTSKTLSYFADTLVPGIGGAVGQVFDFLSQDTEQFKETINKLFGPEFIDNVLNNLLYLVEQIPAILDRIINYLSENMPAITERLIESIIANFPKIVASFVKAIADPSVIAGMASAIAKGLISGINAAAGDFTRMIVNAFVKAIDSLSSGAQGAGEKLVGFLARTFGGYGLTGDMPFQEDREQFIRKQRGGTKKDEKVWQTWEQKYQRVGLNQDELEYLEKEKARLRDTAEYAYYGEAYISDFEKQYRARRLGLSGFPGFSHGGIIPAYASGGLIDNQLIRASAGEFMVNKDSTSANMGLLNAINNSNGRNVSSGSTIVINVNGGMLGDRQSAQEFAKAVDEELYRLRVGNASRAFDRSLY